MARDLQRIEEAGAGGGDVKADRIPAPIFFCTMQAVAGKNMSGVTVATMMSWMSSAVTPASAMARRAASEARSLVAWSAAAMRRSLMPVREVIHSSLVSTIFERSSLVSTFSGM
jgi:hypothetical protein